MSTIPETTSACSRFFSIAELVTLFLHQADTTALINCQRVCYQWNNIIKSSEALQERLFLVPALADRSKSSRTVTLNPLLEKCFGRILGAHDRFVLVSRGREALRTESCTYSDLSALPWVQDGTYEDAPARLAFSRKEASWRRMLLSQPPIQRLDWWHEWESAVRRKDGGEPFTRLPMRSGQGHGSLSSTMTIGTLWDIIEPLLLRECQLRTVFYLSGGSAADDPMASFWEKTFEADTRAGVIDRDFSTKLPRISLQSQQVWPGEARMAHACFDVATKSWQISDEIPAVPLTEMQKREYQARRGNGFEWLNIDCRRDRETENARWSSSDAFEIPALRMGSSSSGGGW